MSSYRKLSYYGRDAGFKVHNVYLNGITGHLVVYVSKDTANVTIQHSEWIVPGTLDVHNY